MRVGGHCVVMISVSGWEWLSIFEILRTLKAFLHLHNKYQPRLGLILYS